ncbi:MAG TPA: PQQ-binding-like beta-propeller repeat protein [Polyangiaceae bacterium]
MRCPSIGLPLILAASACATEGTQSVVATPSPEPSVTQGQSVVVVSPPPKPPVPFELPKGFRARVDRPALVATLGDRLVLLRRIERCEKIPGPSGTVYLPKLGAGTFTAPASDFHSCTTWVDALDRDGAPIWASPTEPGHRFMIVLGDRFLAAGPGGAALFDVATGERRNDVRDPVLGREVCVDAPHDRAFFSDWDDKTKDAVVDLGTMRVDPAGAQRCPVEPFTRCDEGTALACLEPRDERRPPTTAVSGFYEASTLRSGADEVLLGHRTRGRKLPMVVAIDPTSHAKRWSLVVPPADTQAQAAEDALFPHRFVDIAFGTLFLEYDAWANHPHLAAFDMKDGARRWDVPVGAFVGFTPTADRIYLSDKDGMRVLDARTGAERFNDTYAL